MTDPYGPIWAAGFQDVTKNGYKLLYLADLHNEELQAEGKPPVYWWLPDEVRLAQRDDGDFIFSFLHFEGVRSDNTNVGVQGSDNEVAGGLLGFSTTTAPPAEVLTESENEILNRFRGNDDRYWGWRTSVAPQFRPAPIVSNTTMVTNLSPNPDGSVPAVAHPPGAAPAGPAGPGGPPPVGGGAPPGQNGPPPGAGLGTRGLRRPSLRELSIPPIIRSASVPPRFVSPRTVPASRGFRDSNLDQWFFHLQGQGAGSVSPFAQNAYSALVGSLPAAMIWASFHQGSSAITVWQYMNIRVWSPAVHIHLEGDWDKVQDHISAAGHYGGWFNSVDVQAEFNSMRLDGTIDVTIEVDTTLPNAQALQESIDKRSDLVFQKFMDEAQKVIFDPAPFQEQPAEASGGFLGWGGGVALKMREDRTHMHLSYDEHREMAYLQNYPVSGQMEGLYDVIKKDPTQEKKYFTTLYLSDWERKVSRIVKPVVNWPDPSQKWVGEPVSFLSAQIGYPNTDGVIQWDGHMFQASDGPDAVWNTATEMKATGDVAHPPPNWTPDKTFVKRQIHFAEPPNETENPFARVSIEKNVVDLDPADIGRPLSDINLEVRVDNVGALNVGPIILNVQLENAAQMIVVTFQAMGLTDAGTPRVPVRLQWQYADQDQPRYWMVFTGQPGYLPMFTYQVDVIVRGSIFTKGMEWLGPVVRASGNGPITISVPTPTDPGVQTRALPGWLMSMPMRSGVPIRYGRAAPPPQRTIVLPEAAPAGAGGAPRQTRRPAPSRRSAPVPAGVGGGTVRGWAVPAGGSRGRTAPASSAAPSSSQGSSSRAPSRGAPPPANGDRAGNGGRAGNGKVEFTGFSPDAPQR